MLYTIRIHYTTGDSFGSEKTFDDLPICWTKKHCAESALECVKRHREACDAIRNTRYQADNEQLIMDYMGEYWFVPSHDNEYFYYLNVMTDACDMQRLSAFWMGYFETIHSAEIIEYENEHSTGISVEF